MSIDKITQTPTSIEVIEKINELINEIYNMQTGQDVILPITKGGTGLDASPSMLVNLASKNAANVLQASPKPGVTGVLGLKNGGTGSDNAIEACKNLGIFNNEGQLVLPDGSKIWIA